MERTVTIVTWVTLTIRTNLRQPYQGQAVSAAAKVLERARAAGVQLEARGGRLAHDAPVDGWQQDGR